MLLYKFIFGFVFSHCVTTGSDETEEPVYDELYEDIPMVSWRACVRFPHALYSLSMFSY